MGTGSFPGLKRPERGVYHPPQSSSEVKRKSRAVPLLPISAFVPWYRVDFTFLSLHILWISDLFSRKLVVGNKYRDICFATNVRFYGIIYGGF